MRALRTILYILLGIVLGVTLVVGGVAGVGWYMLSKEGMVGKIEEKIDFPFDFSEDIKNMSVLEFAGNVQKAFASGNIGEIEKAVGYPIAEEISKMIGISVEALQNSKISEIGQTISNNLTMGGISDAFDIALPSFPLFKDEEFLASPISTALADLDKKTLDSFLEIVYDDEATEEKPASSTLLQKLGSSTLTELSADTDKIIDDLFLKDVIDIPDDSLLAKFKEIKIGNLGTEFDGVIDTMKLGEILEITPQSTKILLALKDCTLSTQKDEAGNVTSIGINDRLETLTLGEMVDTGSAHIWSYLSSSTLSSLGKDVDDMTLGDAIVITSDSHPILKKLDSAKINEFGTALDNAIETTTLGEFLNIDEMDSPSPMLEALKDVCLEGEALNAALKGFEIGDVFENTKGILSLVPDTTLISDLPEALAAKVSTTNIYRLAKLGIVTASFDTATPEAKAMIYNNAINDVVNNYIKMLNNPADAVNILKPKTVLFTDEVLTNSALKQLSGFEEGVTVVLTKNTAIPAGEVFDVYFNIDASNSTYPDITLSVGDNVSVTPPSDTYGFMYIKTRTALANDITAGHAVDGEIWRTLELEVKVTA